MSDSIETLFRESVDELPDDGFTESVMRHIEPARIVRRGLQALIVLALAALAFGPLSDLAQVLARIAPGLDWAMNPAIATSLVGALLASVTLVVTAE